MPPTPFQKLLREAEAPYTIKYRPIRTKFFEIWVQPSYHLSSVHINKINFWDFRILMDRKFVSIKDLPYNILFAQLYPHLYDDHLYRNVPTEWTQAVIDLIDEIIQ